ncbi:pleiotropic regulatory protein RsmS [Vibrio ziniensis]|uniref:Pleiotropic regulatory protein RsmS n=1 Tax=Vibrio ziniensis TaxID=2711221 RepID=A0A6G7CH05_9VIBR|nr:pleiotropic regulatory protein RsmS [Vibrio ziniensis]QIH41353.1 pleiotropic regulatory protein RsmS [Vibrio ziniensis]
MNDTSSSLENASDDIKLAVDLIYLLESNNVDTEIALAALEIVKADFQAKLKKEKSAN